MPNTYETQCLNPDCDAVGVWVLVLPNESGRCAVCGQWFPDPVPAPEQKLASEDADPETEPEDA